MSEKMSLEEWTAFTKKEFDRCSFSDDWPALKEKKVHELMNMFEMSEEEALDYVHEM